MKFISRILTLEGPQGYLEGVFRTPEPFRGDSRHENLAIYRDPDLPAHAELIREIVGFIAAGKET